MLITFLDTAIWNLGCAARTLRRSRGFTLMAIAVLALGIGSITAIFSVVNRVLLEPLPYPEPHRLVQLIAASQLGDQTIASIPKYVVWRDHTSVFQSMAAYDIGGPALKHTAADISETLTVARVSSEYFNLFGARVALGRSFSRAEDRAGGPAVAVMSDLLWRRRFDGDPAVVGRAISLQDVSYRVVGVIAPGTTLNPLPDIWLPLQADPSSIDHISRVRVVARLKPGISVADAQEDVRKTMRAFLQKYPANSPSEAPLIPLEGFWAIPLRDAVVGDVRPALYLLTGAVGFVLLVSCANVGSLFVARASRRAREFAIRVALGASRGQIVRQLLTESILLSLGGGLLGLVLGHLGVQGLLAVSPSDLSRIGANGLLIRLDWRVVSFTCVVSAFTGVLFGLMPAMNASRVDVSILTKDNASQSGMGFRMNRSRPALVITEMALALVLLVGAGLLIRTFAMKRAISRGFDEQNVFTLEMSLSSPQFAETNRVAKLVHEMELAATKLEGVSALATTSALPLLPSLSMPFTIYKNDQGLGRYDGVASWRSVSAGYFNVFKIRLLRGRLFTENDDGQAAGVVLINRAMMKKYWQEVDANPIGEFITIGKGMDPVLQERPRQIIGVVADVRDAGLDRDPTMYLPVAQLNDGMNARNNRLLPVAWVIRTAGVQPAAIAGIQQELQLVSGGRPTGRVRTMHEVIAESSARAQFYMVVLSTFAAIALVLAALGLYSLTAYTVQQRTHEIGIRLALGAEPRKVRRMVVLQGLRLTLLGIVIGIPSALALARVTVSMIFDIRTWDATVLALVTISLSAVSLLAAVVPSVRAARVNPADALRY